MIGERSDIKPAPRGGNILAIIGVGVECLRGNLLRDRESQSKMGPNFWSMMVKPISVKPISVKPSS